MVMEWVNIHQFEVLCVLSSLVFFSSGVTVGILWSTRMWKHTSAKRDEEL